MTTSSVASWIFFDADPHGTAAVYLFGSTARGTGRPGSDIDLGILFRETPADTFDSQPYNLEAALERRIGRTVDVIVLDRAPVDLRSRVLRGGRLIVEWSASETCSSTATATSTWRSSATSWSIDSMI
jgi:predicted nucleotidyltransferase